MISEVYIKFFKFCSAAIILTSCFEGILVKEEGTSALTNNSGNQISLQPNFDQDGVSTTTVSSNSQSTQLLQASEDSEISGTQISISPGTLAIDTEITIEEGSGLANSSTVNELELGSNDLTEASAPVVVTSSVDMDTAEPFTLAIPKSDTSLFLQGNDKLLVVIYKVKKMSLGGQIVIGVITSEKLTLKDGKIYFDTNYFGSYQLAYSEIEIKKEDVKEKEASTPILTKAIEKKLPEISWNNISLQFNDENRNATITGDLSGIDELKSCVAIYDENKEKPFDFKKTGESTSISIEITKDTKGIFYSRLECLDTAGRISISPWSNKIVIAEVIISAPIEVEFLSQSGQGEDAISINIEWIIKPTDGIDGFTVKKTLGSTAPDKCDGGDSVVLAQEDASNSSEVFFSIRYTDLVPDTKYSFKICAIKAGITIDSVNTSVSTVPLYVGLCDSGDLSTTCYISSPTNITTTDVISGPGNLVIADGGQLYGDNILIHMSGEVKIDKTGSAYLNAIVGNTFIESDSFSLCGGSYCKISASGSGYLGGQINKDGQDNGSNFHSGKFTAGSAGGGGNGGAGTDGDTVNAGGAGDMCNSNIPESPGAGGGGTIDSVGGNGGGVIRIIARQVDLLGGYISANGDMSPDYYEYGGGGGAGGSIWITSKIFNETASYIEANGGYPGMGMTEGGEGGGGCIKIEADANQYSSSGIITANGGNLGYVDIPSN